MRAVVIQVKSQRHLAGAIHRELPAVQQIIPTLRHRLNECRVIRAKRRRLHVKRRHQRRTTRPALLLHLHAGQTMRLLLVRLLDGARTRLLLLLRVLRLAQRQIARPDRRLQFLLRRGRCRLKFVKVRARHVLGFGDLGLFAVQLRKILVPLRLAGGAGILAGIILCVWGRFGRRLRHLHERQLFFVVLRRRHRHDFHDGQTGQPRWPMQSLPPAELFARFITTPREQMHRKRQRQCQAQPPHFGAAEPQRIKSCADSRHVLKDCLRQARPATVFTTRPG